MPISHQQELHNYLQSIYRNSNALTINVEEVDRGVWRANVFIHGSLVGQAIGPSARDAREEAAAKALVQYRRD